MGIAISVTVYLLMGDAGSRDGDGRRFESPEERAEFVFLPTGTYVGGDPSMPLIVHAFEVTPDYISVVYTLVGGSNEAPRSCSPAIVDDKGRTYRTLGNAILGSADGVLAGVLVVEAHIPGGSLLTIEASSVETAGGTFMNGRWSIPFLVTTEPAGSLTHIGGRLSPEEGVGVNGARVGIAGPPGSSPVEVLVHRDGKTTSLFGLVDKQGATRALSQQEFQGMLGTPGYPKPPAFPTTAPVVP
jgi:hypothetical protein